MRIRWYWWRGERWRYPKLPVSGIDLSFFNSGWQEASGLSSNSIKALRLSTSAGLSWLRRDILPTVTISNINYEFRL